jgi:dCMP deaminase
MAKKIIIAYVPVLHEGYRRFFENHREAERLYIFGAEIIAKFDYLRKEIRALDPELMRRAIESLRIFKTIEILSEKKLKLLAKENGVVVMPREDVTKSLAKTHFSGRKIIFDNIFLRWDKHLVSAPKPIQPDIKISSSDFDKKLMEQAKAEGDKSSCWWRRVGGIILKKGKVILISHNKHVPSEHLPYANGDPRNCFKQGVGVELSTSMHVEARLIAEAAKKGISLTGGELYCSDFPCPPCAKLVAYSGIKKLYYNRGYGALDGQDVLKSQGVEIIFVE